MKILIRQAELDLQFLILQRNFLLKVALTGAILLENF